MKQETINNQAKLLYDKLTGCPEFMLLKWKQFGAKQCWVSSCLFNRYFLVKSYNTIVAIIDDQNAELYELGKWSTTTSKQVTQLFNLKDYESYKMFGFSKLVERYLVK